MNSINNIMRIIDININDIMSMIINNNNRIYVNLKYIKSTK